jgi:hypothetical protein
MKSYDTYLDPLLCYQKTIKISEVDIRARNTVLCCLGFRPDIPVTPVPFLRSVCIKEFNLVRCNHTQEGMMFH